MAKRHGSLSEHLAALVSRELGQQTNPLQSIVDSMGDGVVVADRRGQLLLANPAARRILRKDLTGLAAQQWPTALGFCLPDGCTPYPVASLPMARALRGEVVEIADMFMRHAGAPEGRWLGVTARPVRDRQGRVQAGVAIFRDITTRKKAEQSAALQRATEERLQLLVDASGVLLGSLELSGMLPQILELAQKMIAADAYAIWRADVTAGIWRVVASAGLSEEYQQATMQGGNFDDLLRAPMSFEDVETTPFIELRRERYRAEGIRSLLALPLRIHGANSGTITFYYRRRHRFDQAEIRLGSALANLAAAAIGSAELFQEQKRLRAEAEEGERRSAFLAEATTLLGSSLDYETTLAQVARLAVPHMADWCTIDMIEPEGGVRQLALAHADPAKVEWARELGRRYPPDPNSNRGSFEVMRSGRSILMPEVTEEMVAASARDEEHRRILREVGLCSYMCVPVVARGRTLGTITFVSAESGRRFSAADQAVAEHLGRRAGLAIDNARLYEAARRSEARFRRLVESGIIGIVVGEGDRIAEANDVFLEMLGYSREEFAAGGLSWHEISAPEYAHVDARATEQMLARGACSPYEKEYFRKDGTRVPALLGAVLLEPPPRFSWVCFVLDLGERKRLEERLRESAKLESIGLLAGGVAHDFNNLLTGILGNASLALDELAGASNLQPILENVVRAAERAADLTRQLLAYSGRGQFVIQPIEVSELVREISTLLQMSIPKKVQLRLDLAAGLPPVQADSSQIQQLIMNLVINGAEAIGDAVGVVTVTTGLQHVDGSYARRSVPVDEFVPGPYVCLEVKDTGCGMDEDTRSRIFDPFFTTKFTGRGLGLAAAQGIVRGHQGDIQVESTPGIGSTFRVLLPAASLALEHEAPVEVERELLGSGTVLFADDEEIVRSTGRTALERYGYDVLLVANGLEAVQTFRRVGADIALVVLDLTMPVMGGEEALAELKRMRPDVRVIVSSGYSEIEAIRRFSGAGVAAFLQKPYTAQQLAEKVKAVLEGGIPALGTSQAGGLS